MKRFELTPNDTLTLHIRALIIPFPWAYSTWARWWWSCSSQDGNSFLIALACWRLANCSPILLCESLFFGHVFIYPWSPWGWYASSIWSLLDSHLELALHFFIRQNISTIIRCFHYYKPCSESLGFHFFILHFFKHMISSRCSAPSWSSRHTCHRLISYLTNIWTTP